MSGQETVMVNGDPNGINPWDQERKRKEKEKEAEEQLAAIAAAGVKADEENDDWSDEDEDPHQANKLHQHGLAKQLGDYRKEEQDKASISKAKQAAIGGRQNLGGVE